MRLAKLCLGFAVLLSPCLLAQAPATAPGAMPVCDGNLVVTRVSTIKPGMMATFQAAVAAQLAWYRTNGVKDNQIVMGKVIAKDASGAYSFSDTTALTYHINPPRMDIKLPRGDDGWKAFVKLFRDSSDIQAEYTTCTPKMM